MTKFQVGSKVINIDSRKKGVVTEILECFKGRQYYMVNYGGVDSEEMEVDLIEDCDISNVFDRCKGGLFGSYSEFSQKNTSEKIKSSNNSTISSLKASKTIFKTYQFKPLLKFINSPVRRLLIADEVGLGKTIEAGHIMLELKARNEFHNVLIVCPKSLQIKWREELKEKFALFFKIYDDYKDLIYDLEDHNGMVRAIINYEKIRYAAPSKKSDSNKKNHNLAEYLISSDKKFSLVLCDEAHRMRNENTLTYKGAEIINNIADAAVFLTATPVMTDKENLYNLLHLLDSTRFFEKNIFLARLEENRPFVNAITELNHYVPFKKIRDELLSQEIETTFYNSDKEIIYTRNRTIDEAYSKDPVFQEIIQKLNAEDNLSNRARLQYLLNTMSIMNNVFSRTIKKDVYKDMSKAERKPNPRKIVLSPNERKYYDEVIEQYIEDNSYIDWWGEERLTQGGALGLVQKKRQVASSVYAYLNSEEDLDLGIDRYDSLEDAKVEELVRIIEEVFKHGTQKIIIFALFRRTLKYLSIRLKKRGYNSLIIHGQISNRAEILDQFKNNPNNHILLSSEVGSEGLDMQFCNSMVNYDLPWNPMVVEQRIGRIDRFGQKSPVVNIYNFIVADSIQEKIYMRLLDRIGIFKGTIGDMEAILDSPFAKTKKTIMDVYNDLEHELFTSKLSDEEIERKLDSIRLAYEKEKQSIEELQKGLENTLTNDSYFQDEIDKISKNNAFVTEEELKNYLEEAIEKHLTTCSLVEIDDKIYELRLPMSNSKILSQFLNSYKAEGRENDIAYNRFNEWLKDKKKIVVTFNQQKAYGNNSLIFLNIYHPIIQSCLKYFSSHNDDNVKSFCFSLKSDDTLKADSFYYMCIYKFSTKRKVQGVMKNSDVFVPFVYDIKKEELIEDENIVNRLFSISQIEGKELNPEESWYQSEIVDNMRYIFKEASSRERKKRLNELQNQAESQRLHDEMQTIEYYNISIQKMQDQINAREWEIESLPPESEDRQNKERVLNMDKGKLDARKNELQEKLKIINENTNIDIESVPSSIALIKIA